MGMIGSGEAYDYRVPYAKQIGDPSRRWDKVSQVIRCNSEIQRSHGV